MRPACSTPIKAMMYSRPCGANIATRSPLDAYIQSSSATIIARRWTCHHVTVSVKPAGSVS